MRADWKDWIAVVADSGLAPASVWMMTIRVAVAPTRMYCDVVTAVSKTSLVYGRVDGGHRAVGSLGAQVVRIDVLDLPSLSFQLEALRRAPTDSASRVFRRHPLPHQQRIVNLPDLIRFR